MRVELECELLGALGIRALSVALGAPLQFTKAVRDLQTRAEHGGDRLHVVRGLVERGAQHLELADQLVFRVGCRAHAALERLRERATSLEQLGLQRGCVFVRLFPLLGDRVLQLAQLIHERPARISIGFIGGH